MNSQSCENIQSDLIRFAHRSEEWPTRFNVDKCKVMQIGEIIPNIKYQIQGHELSEVKQEQVLGIIISNKMSDQCSAASKKSQYDVRINLKKL